MTTYYIDPVNGSNSNNGLGPDASHATNKPWATIGKALGGSGIASGDTVYLAPGTYREAVSVSMTSPTVETKILGDPTNTRGFKTSGGVLVTPGPVIHSAYTTNDKTAPSAGTTLWTQARNFLTFQNIMFVCGTGNVMSFSPSSSDLKFVDCVFYVGGKGSGSVVASSTAAFGVPLNHTFDRCVMITGGTAAGSIFNYTVTKGTGSDYDINVVVKNCLILSVGGGVILQIAGTGTGSNKGNGFHFRNCTVIGGAMVWVNTADASTTIPTTVTNCFIYTGGNTALIANTSGQITEDYNVIASSTGRTNVTAGAHSISDGSYAPLFHLGQERIWGMFLRPFGEPTDNSPLLGYGNDGTQSATDGYNRPRPAGGQSALPAVGFLGRSNTWTQESSQVHGAATFGAQCIGPGYQDFDVEVDNVVQSIAVWMRFDSTYDASGTAKPSIEVLANDECGVAAASQVMTASANTWQQLTLSFTPTAKGIVTIRLRSQDANGGGVAFASDKSGW